MVIAVRLVEISTLLTFFLLCLTLTVALYFAKKLIIIVSILIKPTLSIVVFCMSLFMDLFSWSLDQTLETFADYGRKLLEAK